jgi:hypothetical protein
MVDFVKAEIEGECPKKFAWFFVGFCPPRLGTFQQGNYFLLGSRGTPRNREI